MRRAVTAKTPRTRAPGPVLAGRSKPAPLDGSPWQVCWRASPPVWHSPPVCTQQVPGTTQAGYTAAQAEAGAAVYVTSFSSCHLANRQGSFEAPQLAGPNFLTQWGHRPVA
jgi:hypothetical protein